VEISPYFGDFTILFKWAFIRNRIDIKKMVWCRQASRKCDLGACAALFHKSRWNQHLKSIFGKQVAVASLFSCRPSLCLLMRRNLWRRVTYYGVVVGTSCSTVADCRLGYSVGGQTSYAPLDQYGRVLMRVIKCCSRSAKYCRNDRSIVSGVCEACQEAVWICIDVCTKSLSGVEKISKDR